MVTNAGTRKGTCYDGGMSKTVSSGAVDAVGVSDTPGNDLTVAIDLPVLQLEALNMDYDGAVPDMPALESPLDSDEEGLTCVDCGEPTYDECEDCGDPLCCDDVCSYCAL